jgi:hypothetical protein
MPPTALRQRHARSRQTRPLAACPGVTCYQPTTCAAAPCGCQKRRARAELEAVPGLVKEDFDFEATLRDIHTELADLNKEAVELAARIQANFEELGI